MATPTLINLPPPPSDPVTPSDMGPGTPNSGTTSLSALSTTAIKDGHQGHPHRQHHASQLSTSSTASTTTLDAERADRISRLAGLERVATARGTSTSHANPTVGSNNPPINQPPGYFDTGAGPQIKERSTVGSASATGSVGGRTTWASGSDVYEADKMSEDQDDGVSSVGGFSDEGNASLVAFGEGAGSTISGPISTAAARAAAARQSSVSSPSTSKASTAIPPHVHTGSVTPMSGVVPSPPPNTTAASPDPRLMDGVTYDANVLDTTVQSPVPVGGSVTPQGRGADLADRILRDRVGEGRAAMESPGPAGQQPLGKFAFEEK
ncbi:MAG: hypothetical protein Q9227_008896 [Pyrenula ochraceoflavens]